MKDRAIKHLMRSYGIDIENDDEFLSDLRKIMDDLYVKCPLCGEAENLHENTNYHDTSKPPEILCNECGEYFLSPITPEPGESGQSAEDVLSRHISKEGLIEVFLTFDVLEAMNEYASIHASQVCADKDVEIRTLERFRLEDAASAIKDQLISYEQIKSLRSELAKANESLTVMLRKNAELEKELEYAKIR